MIGSRASSKKIVRLRSVRKGEAIVSNVSSKQCDSPACLQETRHTPVALVRHHKSQRSCCQAGPGLSGWGPHVFIDNAMPGLQTRRKPLLAIPLSAAAAAVPWAQATQQQRSSMFLSPHKGSPHSRGGAWGGGRGGHMRRLEEDLRGRLTRHGPFRSMAEPVPCDRMREDCAITQTAVSAQDSRPTPDPPCTLGFKAQCGAALPAAPHPAAHWLRP